MAFHIDRVCGARIGGGGAWLYLGCWRPGLLGGAPGSPKGENGSHQGSPRRHPGSPRGVKKWLKNNFKSIIFNGSQSQKLPGLISVSFPGFSSEILIVKLDREKIYVSNGSACGSGIVKPSHVLSAIGLDESVNLSTLRFSFGLSNNLEEIKTLTHILKDKILKWKKKLLLGWVVVLIVQ